MENADDVEVVEVENTDEVEVEDTDGGTDEDDISTWSSVDTPSSPTFSVFTEDGSLPPTSDASTELAEEVDDDVNGMQEWPTLKRKCCDESGLGAIS